MSDFTSEYSSFLTSDAFLIFVCGAAAGICIVTVAIWVLIINMRFFGLRLQKRSTKETDVEYYYEDDETTVASDMSDDNSMTPSPEKEQNSDKQNASDVPSGIDAV
jgi:hypothetical protein